MSIEMTGIELTWSNLPLLRTDASYATAFARSGLTVLSQSVRVASVVRGSRTDASNRNR